ncbi:SIN1-domain-containing protein [Marasmius fiardii PR-910]|nr:SIN1-domain-containing protein [Marasmius fiardii PR-910]
MSLISDTDFLIHSLRLSYLRDVEDVYGSRIISLDPTIYNSNPYIHSSGLADSERWPEIDMPASPNISEDEAERPTGFPGARLKHTQTIMGGRSGGMGLRVHGKRHSTSKRMSMSDTPRQGDLTVQNFVANGALNDGHDLEMPKPNKDVNGLLKLPDEPEQAGGSNVVVDVKVVEPTVQEEAPVQRVVQFIPKFKNAKEMEERRRERMAARRRGPNGALGGPTAPLAPPEPQRKPSLNFDTSSDEDMVHIVADSSSNSDFGDSDMENEFDPEFTARGIHSDSVSDASLPSIATSSVAGFTGNTRPRLSPVDESSGGAGHHQHHHHSSNAPNTQRSASDAITGAKSSSSRRPSVPPRAGSANAALQTNSSNPQASSEASLFSRKRVPPLRPQKSSLSAMLAASGSLSNNPFAEIYSSISGRGESASTNVLVYFPHSSQPSKGMDLNVRKDATVEEVIGFALWTYWEEGWLPRLDEGLTEEKDPEKWAIRMSAVGWILRITEEDGEVDDDFPPPDRTGKISKFNADAYAVLEANAAQIAQNQILESKIQRPTKPPTTKRPSAGDKSSSTLNLPSTGAAVVGSASASFLATSALGSVPLSTSLGPSTQGPQMFLRIRIADQADAVHFSTTIPVSAGMYMQEVLEAVCRKRGISNKSSDYALLIADMKIFIPLDRTVASLQGRRELVLVKRSALPQLGVDVLRAGRTTDPNASIFKRMSDAAPEVKLSAAMDFTAAYKKYTVYRKLPMLVTRQEKTLAIDGGYVHIMPPRTAKAVFDSGRTSSYHIKSISECHHSTKSPHMFKLVLNRASGDKRYYFEAENAKSAEFWLTVSLLSGEIVQTVKSLKTALERSSTISKARRSRQAV